MPQCNRTGLLWQNRFFSCPVEEEAVWEVLSYIELTRVRAGLVDKAWEWEWCSAAAHVTGADRSGLLDMHLWQRHFNGATRKQYLEHALAQKLIQHRIRTATAVGRMFGSADAEKRLEQQLGRLILPQKRGRKPARVCSVATRNISRQTIHSGIFSGSLDPSTVIIGVGLGSGGSWARSRDGIQRAPTKRRAVIQPRDFPWLAGDAFIKFSLCVKTRSRVFSSNLSGNREVLSVTASPSKSPAMTFGPSAMRARSIGTFLSTGLCPGRETSCFFKCRIAIVLIGAAGKVSIANASVFGSSRQDGGLR